MIYRDTHTILLLTSEKLLQSCFTGVESTPKITYRDVKENRADRTAPEEILAEGFIPSGYEEWKPGKRLFVTSDRISLVLTPDNPASALPAESSEIVFQGEREVPDLTGRKIVELLFPRPSSSDFFAYRMNSSREELVSRTKAEVPFTIDLDLVAKVRSALVGKDLYVKTPLWFTPDGQAVEGRKFVKVDATDLLPANEVYPFRVLFTDSDNGATHFVFMSAGNGSRWAPREFPAIFSFTDPHLEYPRITDEVWSYHIRTRVRERMTKPEARLSLGDPANIDHGHDHTSAYERWNYSNGIYLIFEDGLLTRFNR